VEHFGLERESQGSPWPELFHAEHFGGIRARLFHVEQFSPDTHSYDFGLPASESAASNLPSEACTVFPLENVPRLLNVVAVMLSKV
jgi:hypothetical protein